jgi:ferredoxin
MRDDKGRSVMKKTQFSYYIDEEACINCGSCRRFCPVDTIPYFNLQHQVDMEGCIGCTICYAVCPVDAVMVTETNPPHAKVIFDPDDMERVRKRNWARGPFFQMKKRQTIV